MIYVDSAAAVKLLHSEEHSDALRGFLDQHAETEWASSTLLEIETYRALSRVTSTADMPNLITQFHGLLDLFVRIEINPAIRILAQTVAPPTVRSLDAIHLGTALHLRKREQLTAFVTYDKRLADAASSASLPVAVPLDQALG